MKNSDGRKNWYVQPADGAWINGVFQRQNTAVLMTDDEAKYLVMANILSDKPVEKAAPAPASADESAGKPAKKGGVK